MNLKGEPHTGTFWLIAMLSGGIPERTSSEVRLIAKGRGSELEAMALSTLTGFALYGVCAAISGSLILGILIAVLALHVVGFIAAFVGEGLIKLRLLKEEWRPAVATVFIMGGPALVAVACLAAGKWQAVLALPLIAFILVELLAFPVKILWQRTEP